MPFLEQKDFLPPPLLGSERRDHRQVTLPASISWQQAVRGAPGLLVRRVAGVGLGLGTVCGHGVESDEAHHDEDERHHVQW